MRNWPRYLAAIALATTLLMSPRPAIAQTPDAPRCGTGVHEAAGTGTVFFPEDQIFCPLIADPKEARSFLSFSAIIPAASS